MNVLDLPCPFCATKEDYTCWHCYGMGTVRGCAEAEEDQFQHEQGDVLLMRLGLEMAFTSFLSEEDDYLLSRSEKVFYLLKLLICYVLELDRREAHGSYPDTVTCSTPHYRRDGYGWDASMLVVGHGFFQNWFCSIETDGDSFL